MNRLAPITASYAPALIAASGPRASYRFLEFFTANIRNAHTRRAYARAATEFFDWLAGKGVTQLAGIESIQVAAYIEELSRARSVPTAKLRLAAPRHLFDWLVIGRILPANPAAAVRGPLHIVPTKSVPIAFRDMSDRPPKPTAAPVESRIRLNSTLSERIRACFA
jgi:Phage integrase, N-terminal SAM-like domain